MTPTARTLEECRKRGYTAQVVEKWIPQAQRRVDLFDVIDVVCCVPPVKLAVEGSAMPDSPGYLLGIQTTTMSNKSARIEKIRQSPRAAAWLASGGRIAVWSWRKLKVKRGGKAVKWQLDEEVLDLSPPPNNGTS